MRASHDDERQHNQTRQLLWVQPKWYRRAYDLRDDEWTGGVVLGSLRWESAWRAVAVAEVGSERWRFSRGGFFRPSVMVAEVGSGARIGAFEGGWNGAGMLSLATGQVFSWRKANWWGSRWEWADPMGTRLALFRRAPASGRQEQVELSPATPLAAGGALLVALGWYLIVLAQAAASAAAGA
jgi:hypothetical protein